LAKRSRHIVLIEQNYHGQLGKLIRMECGMDIADKILKYDGRPFFYDELLALLLERLVNKSEVGSVFEVAPAGV
jgi:2-oxoglutarate/2-oxoacid ferredoxin oxidoreductase subunit alpha